MPCVFNVVKRHLRFVKSLIFLILFNRYVFL